MDNKQAIKNIKEHCYFANLNPKAKQALDRLIKSAEDWNNLEESVNKLLVYHVTSQGSELLSKNAVIRLINKYSKYGSEYPFTLRYKPNENKEKLITEWLIENVFRNEKYYELHDEDTLKDIIWNLMEIIASLHNEYYKAIHGQYYDYMFHWVNKMNAESIIDDIFKEFG